MLRHRQHAGGAQRFDRRPAPFRAARRGCGCCTARSGAAASGASVAMRHRRRRSTQRLRLAQHGAAGRPGPGRSSASDARRVRRCSWIPCQLVTVCSSRIVGAARASSQQIGRQQSGECCAHQYRLAPQKLRCDARLQKTDRAEHGQSGDLFSMARDRNTGFSWPSTTASAMPRRARRTARPSCTGRASDPSESAAPPPAR